MITRARKRALGQYFTPDAASRFVARLTRACAGAAPDSVLDPACGDGSFLRAADLVFSGEPVRLYGMDIDRKAVESASRTGGPGTIVHANALSERLPQAIPPRADVVLANPPYGGGRGSGRLEVRFLERIVELTAPGGVAGVILPTGMFANASSQRLRDALLDRITPRAVVELPAGLFRATGAAARTLVLVFERRAPAADDTCVLDVLADEETGDRIIARIDAPGATGPHRRAIEMRGTRWDPAYWTHPANDMIARARVRLEPLGEFITHITYGPIVTGSAQDVPQRDEVVVVGLRELTGSGLDLRTARRVSANGIYDPPRCRLQRGDIVMARSGVGSLMKGRAAVFDEQIPATVACFVDLIRLAGIDPGYVLVCLRSAFVREQIARLANGVGTPNLSFREIRSLMIPRLGVQDERDLSRRESDARHAYRTALTSDSSTSEASRGLEEATAILDNAVLCNAE